MPDSIPLANWNGELMPLDQVRVSVLDRAFLFGDAIYEALRVYGGKTWLHGDHMARLARSLGEVRIETDIRRIENRMAETLAKSGVAEGLVYIQVTRGAAPRTHYFPPAGTKPNELIFVSDIGGDPYAGVRETGVGIVTHDDLRWRRCDIKSVNLLGNCIAMQAAKNADCTEAWLINEAGDITEATHSSAFAVSGGKILAPPLGPSLLPGVTRKFMLELAESESIEVVEQSFGRDRLFELDELFMTGTTMEVLPVVRVDGRPAGGGRPGPVTTRLYQAFQRAVADFLKS